MSTSPDGPRKSLSAQDVDAWLLATTKGTPPFTARLVHWRSGVSSLTPSLNL